MKEQRDRQGKKNMVISCSYSNSIINLHGKLIKSLLLDYHVNIITPKITNSQIRATLEEWGVSIYEIKLNPNQVSILADLRYMFNLIRIIKLTKADIFFAYMIKPISYGNLAAWMCGVRKVASLFTGLGYMFQNEQKVSILKCLFRLLLKLSLRINKATIVFFQNKDDYKELLNLKILSKENKVHIVNGCGIDVDDFSYSEPKLEKIKFLMIAKLVNAKGVREFYEAAKIIKDKYPTCEFHLLGEYEEGGTDSIPKTLFSKISDNRVIQYHGWIDDVRSMIIRTSVFVLPSYREGVPRSSLEAMAIGRPLITTDAIGCRETVLSSPEEINGFMVNQRNGLALAEKMEFFINNPDKIIDYGLNGRKLVVSRFEVDKINNEIRHALGFFQ